MYVDITFLAEALLWYSIISSPLQFVAQHLSVNELPEQLSGRLMLCLPSAW